MARRERYRYYRYLAALITFVFALLFLICALKEDETFLLVVYSILFLSCILIAISILLTRSSISKVYLDETGKCKIVEGRYVCVGGCNRCVFAYQYVTLLAQGGDSGNTSFDGDEKGPEVETDLFTGNDTGMVDDQTSDLKNTGIGPMIPVPEMTSNKNGVSSQEPVSGPNGTVSTPAEAIVPGENSDMEKFSEGIVPITLVVKGPVGHRILFQISSRLNIETATINSGSRSVCRFPVHEAGPVNIQWHLEGEQNKTVVEKPSNVFPFTTSSDVIKTNVWHKGFFNIQGKLPVGLELVFEVRDGTVIFIRSEPDGFKSKPM